MARFLVTGGAGFIGSNLCAALVARGDSVRALDDFSTGRMENIAPLVETGKLELLRGSITDAVLLKTAMSGVDYVLHQAAVPSVPRSIEDPVGTHWVNAHGTMMLLDEARQAHVKRFVFAASSSAYGEKTPGVAKNETMPADPLSPYAAQKLACENYLTVFYKAYGLETVALRYFNVFGPNQDPNSHYAAVIPRFVTAALAGKPATIYGDGEQSRDFCHIENVIEANLLACTAPGVAGEVINIACGEAITLLGVIDQVAKEVGQKIAPQHEPKRVGDIRHSLADISKAKRLLGYTGKIKFPEGIARTVAWYRQKKKA